MNPTSTAWPIAAAMLQFPGRMRDGSLVRDADADVWAASFAEIRRTGFEHVEINDNWIRVAELPAHRLLELADAARASDLAASSLCVVRSSIIDPVDGAENLRYTHRSLEAAAALGLGTVSIGFHRPLLPEQRRALWFWTVQGPIDAPADAANWRLAVSRVQEVGRHAAELGLTLTLEMYEDTYLGTGASAARFVTDVGLDNVGLNPDVGNLIRLHRPIDDWVETLNATLPFATYWHVKNYYRDEDPATGAVTAMPAPLQFGLIDYRTAVREALHLGFTGTFVCEHYGGDGLGVSAANRDYLRTLLPDAVPAHPATSEETSR
jgi:sugar phosphate isomerase/epimerase